MAAAAHCTTAAVYTKKNIMKYVILQPELHYTTTRHLSAKAIKPQCTIIKSNYRLNSKPASLHELADTWTFKC